MMFRYVVTCILTYTIRNPFKFNFISLFTLYLFKNLLFLEKKLRKQNQKNKRMLIILQFKPGSQKSTLIFSNYMQYKKIDNVIPIYSSSSWPLIICLSTAVLIAAPARRAAMTQR